MKEGKKGSGGERGDGGAGKVGADEAARQNLKGGSSKASRRQQHRLLAMHHHPGPQTHRRIHAGRGAAADWP